MTVPGIDALIEALLAGNRRALGRILTRIENDTADGRRALAALYPRSGNAHTIGLTGSAGSGKSTLTGALARELRRRGRTLGIVAIDPTSPFSQGALLGDRIRMQDLTSDPAVFLRSMATRGALGGLAPSTAGVVTALDAFGKDVVIVETVGAGQDEVEIAMMADTTVVVVTPGAGDDVQAMKAGIMEIADVLVVNKSDLPNADLLERQLRSIVEASRSGRVTPIVRTAGALNEGIDALVDALDEHRAYLASADVGRRHRREQARHQVLALARQRLIDRVVLAHGANGKLEELVGRVAERKLDPHAAADELISG
jgi:LAO/AO transport system kinase